MYNPDLLKQQYEQLENGKVRISGMYESIKQADENNDVPFQLYFRIELCDESDWYADSLDMFVVFPKLLALGDKHPDAPSTVYNNNYENAIAHILWVYKWLLNDCSEFYQISKADWEMFLEDFKKRTVAFGYSLREYYSYFGDNELAKKYFELFRNAPRNRNSDCKACDQLEIVKKYLNNNELEKAQREAVVLETRQLSCGNSHSWLRLQNAYMCYYMRNKEFDKIEKYIRLIHRYDNGEIEFDISEEILYYSYTDISKALKIYKREWKEWLTQKILMIGSMTEKEYVYSLKNLWKVERQIQ